MLEGGSVKIADSRNFKVAKKIAVAEVTVEPGAKREMHVIESRCSRPGVLTSVLL